MDQMYRKDRLAAQRDKLRELTNIRSLDGIDPDIDPDLRPSAARLQSIINQIRDIDHKRYGYFRYCLLAVGLVITGAFYAIQGGAVLDVLMVALSFIIYLWIAHRLMRALRAQHGLEHGDHFLPIHIDNHTDQEATVERAKRVIDLSKRRLLMVTLCYVIFFPMLMMLVYAIAIKFTDLAPSVLLAWIAAITLSTVGWYLYDNRSFAKRDELLDALDRLV